MTILEGTQVSGFFNFDVCKLAYSFPFFQDERFDLALSFGLFIMPVEFGFNATGLVAERIEESITAPLPVVCFRGDFALTPSPR